MFRIEGSSWSKALIIGAALVLAGCGGGKKGDGCKTEEIKATGKDTSKAKEKASELIKKFKDAKREKMEGKVLFKDIKTACKAREKKKIEQEEGESPEDFKKRQDKEIKKEKAKIKKNGGVAKKPVVDCVVSITFCPPPDPLAAEKPKAAEAPAP